MEQLPSINLSPNQSDDKEIILELEARFQKLTDPRNINFITYPIHIVYLIIALARLGGCTSCHEIVRYWRLHLQELQGVIKGMGSLIPHRQTIWRLLSIIKADELNEVVFNFFRETVEKRKAAAGKTGPRALEERDVLSADGQNIRATNGIRINEQGVAESKNGYDIVSLYSSEYSIALSQEVVDKKNQEYKSICEMLKIVKISGSILTWDALNTKPKTLQAVLDANADYVVSVKHNAGVIMDDVVSAFEDLSKYPKTHPAWDIALTGEQSNKQGGKLIHKFATLLPAAEVLEPKMINKWPGLKTLIRVTTTTQIYRGDAIEAPPKVMDRYYLSSLEINRDDEHFVDKIQNIILKRWKVERQHWWIDMTFDQDRIPLRNRDYIQNNTVMTKLACNILAYSRDRILPVNSSVSLTELQSICYSSVKTAWHLLEGFVCNDDDAILDDEDLRQNNVVKDPVCKTPDNYVNPYPYGKDVDASTPLGALVLKSSKFRRKPKPAVQR